MTENKTNNIPIVSSGSWGIQLMYLDDDIKNILDGSFPLPEKVENSRKKRFSGLLQEHGGNFNTVSVRGHDTSRIDVYICDYIEYMDELKGYWQSNDYEERAKEKTFKQLLDERCLNHKKIAFEF